MKYIVYQTINKVNNKIYIGVHKTENPDIFDGYLGNGIYVNRPFSYQKGKYPLQNAILKYGIKSFYRITLKEFDSLEEALQLEALLVDSKFIKRTDTYNCTEGGQLPPVTTKQVYLFDLEGKLIKIWGSIKSVTQFYNINKDRITQCINSCRSFNSCYWSFNDALDITFYKRSYRDGICQYNLEGVLLQYFKSVTEASLKLDIPKQRINNAVFSRTRCCGYYFLRNDEDINILLEAKSNKKLCNITPIYRYLSTGEFDCEFKSIKEAVINTPKTSHGNIIRAIKNNRTSGGYKWSYNKDSFYYPFNSSITKAVKVAQYDLNSNLIKIWDTVTECKKHFPCCQKVCRKEQRQTKGFIFEYVS